MLTKAGCNSRQSRLLHRLSNSDVNAAPAQSVDAALIHVPEHILYLSGFFAQPPSLNHNSSSFLLLEKDSRSTLFVDNWLDSAANAAVDEVVTVNWYDCETPAKNRAAVVVEAVIERLQKLRIDRLGAEISQLPAPIANVVGSVVDIDPELRRLRQRKDPDELECIRRGIRTAEAVHAASRQLLEPGMTEIEYYSQLVAQATVAAEMPFVMMCDLASGPRAATGGGEPTLRTMQAGELVILDIFPYVNGYRGDITNTLVVGGKATSEQEDLYSIVHQGLERAERMIAPGLPVRQLFNAVDSWFRASGDDHRLVHHAGHAIGLGHPEAPELVPQSDAVLTEGMVITLEPGLYGAPTGGIRLEHDYLVTESGATRLSNHQLGLS